MMFFETLPIWLSKEIIPKTTFCNVKIAKLTYSCTISITTASFTYSRSLELHKQISLLIILLQIPKFI